MLNNILLIPFLALVFTVVIEVIVAIIFGFKGNNKLKIVALASIITNPILTLILTLVAFFIGSEQPLIFILFLELIVVGVEYYILKYVYGDEEKKIKLFILSLCMNTASYVFGVLVFERILDFLFEL